ncbi:hypothetical protein SAMN02745163_02627 [Clostridium cavendishii DSM 21758]|uniref:Uncharacterized protein n=1 Tax=Clostridium cavendishii DSM 21758 TaxID=1121302 RepID=A0A1M6MG80_9CLOT|nr:hypothetical protein [Clostridium cavendishii]SHJ82489.1 hypothetical protein SAMN02745163_02627 [Clostridium cavendishii DSM 21758]
MYSDSDLDYLAENLNLLNNEDLANAIAALGSTFNWKYINVIRLYKDYDDERVKKEAIESENDLLMSKKINGGNEAHNI